MKNILPTDFQDDILNVSTGGKRKYRMVYNDDGTLSFDDVTPYDLEGSDYGAKQINETNEAVNECFDKNKIIRELSAINAITQEGYVPDALALKDVNNSLNSIEYLYIDSFLADVFNTSTTNYIEIHKKNGICYINGGLWLSDVVNTTTKILANLPKPTFYVGTNVSGLLSEYKKPLVVQITPDGDLNIANGSNSRYNFQLVYPYQEE